MSDTVFKNQEQQIKKLKRLLEGWRMALLPLKSIFLWEQHWHPCAIVGSISIVYFVLWLMDMNFLTTVAVVGLSINLIDFLVPIIFNSWYGPNSWTGQKEKMFEDICLSIVVTYNRAISHIQTFYLLRETSPVMYYIISISVLCSLAWIASSVNNIILFYILSTITLLWPGIQHRGIANTMFSVFNGASPKALKKE